MRISDDAKIVNFANVGNEEKEIPVEEEEAEGENSSENIAGATEGVEAVTAEAYDDIAEEAVSDKDEASNEE